MNKHEDVILINGAIFWHRTTTTFPRTSRDVPSPSPRISKVLSGQGGDHTHVSPNSLKKFFFLISKFHKRKSNWLVKVICCWQLTHFPHVSHHKNNIPRSNTDIPSPRAPSPRAPSPSPRISQSLVLKNS